MWQALCQMLQVLASIISLVSLKPMHYVSGGYVAADLVSLLKSALASACSDPTTLQPLLLPSFEDHLSDYLIVHLMQSKQKFLPSSLRGILADIPKVRKLYIPLDEVAMCCFHFHFIEYFFTDILSGCDWLCRCETKTCSTAMFLRSSHEAQATKVSTQ